jgi:hypothetical protein
MSEHLPIINMVFDYGHNYCRLVSDEDTEGMLTFNPEIETIVSQFYEGEDLGHAIRLLQTVAPHVNIVNHNFKTHN